MKAAALLLALLGSGHASALDANRFVVGSTAISLRVDGKPQPLPDAVVAALAKGASGASGEVLSQILVRELGATRRFRDITIDALPEGDGQTHLRVAAHSSWTVNNVQIRSEGDDRDEDSRFRTVVEVKPGQPLVSFHALDFDSARIEATLKAEGFLKARVRYKAVEHREGEVNVVFLIERGPPCLIADLRPTKSNFGVFKTIRSGDLCNKSQLATRIREEEVRVRNQGFINARLQFDPETDLIPTRDLERATLQYSYDPGERWSLSIVNASTGTALEEQFMSGTGFVLGDLAYTSQEELRQKIQVYFQSLGYADASVNGLEPDKETFRNRDLQFEVDLGRKVYFDAERTEFEGQLPISREAALDALGIRAGILSLGEGVAFDESTLEERRAKLLELYINQGYLDAEIGQMEVHRSPGSSRAWLRIRSDPGRRYVIDTVSLVGKPLSFDERDDIVSEYLQVGEALQPTALRRLEGVLQNELNSAGYRIARVTVPEGTCRERPQKGQQREKKLFLGCSRQSSSEVGVDVVIRIESGPLFRIGSVTANDVPFRKGETVLNVSGLKSGDVLSPRVLSQARDRILKHGLFGNVVFQGSDSFALADSERKQKEVFRDIAIVATRPRNWSLTLNPSWSSDRGYGFRTDFQRNNLTDDGLQLFFQGLLTQDHHQNTASNGANVGQVPGLNLSVGLREAFFRIGDWVSPLDFNLATLGHELDVREERRQTSSLQSDLTWRPSWFGIEFTHKFELAYSFSSYALGGVSRPVRVIDRSNNIGITELVASSALDTTDNAVWPRRGSLTKLSYGHSGKETGSDVSFDRYTLDTNLFASLSRSLTQAFSLGARHVTSADAPGGRREKISGFEVRGFPESNALLGPLLWYPERDIDNKCVVKLSQAATTNVFSARTETRLRFPQSSLGWVLFFDSASAYFTSSEERRFNEKLAAISAPASDVCAANKARIVGNDAVGLQGGSFLDDYWRSSYQSAGLGLRLFLVDLLAINFDWGIPVRDPSDGNRDCVSYATPYKGGDPRNMEPPACIRRKPTYPRPWDSPINVMRNGLDFLLRTQISISGKF